MADDGQVLRKIFFYRISHFDEVKHLLPETLKVIAGLGFHDQGRYQQEVSENALLSVYPETTSYPLKFKFGRTRRDMLPDVEKDGVLSTLSLDENAGLIDVGHIIIFEDGHVAIESNRDAPRIGKLGDYLYLKGKNLPTAPKFLPLFERDIVEALENIDRVRVIELDVPPDISSLIRQADNHLADAIEASERAGSTEKVVLDLVANSNSEVRLKELARKLAVIVKGSQSQRQKFNSLKISGFTNGLKPRKYIDILEEKLVSMEIFVRKSPKSRSIDTDYAFRTLEIAYSSNLDKIKSAAAGGDIWASDGI